MRLIKKICIEIACFLTIVGAGVIIAAALGFGLVYGISLAQL